MQSSRLIQAGTTIINPDRVDFAERENEGEVLVTFSSGEEKKFDGEEANFVWSALSASCQATLPIRD